MGFRQHNTASGLDLHEAKRTKEPVRAASTATVTLATPGATLDGVTLVSGDRILLKDQTAPAENGIWLWTGAAAALTRSLDATTAADFGYLFQVGVREGTVNATTIWVFTQTAALTIGTTALTFSRVLSGTFASTPLASGLNGQGLSIAALTELTTIAAAATTTTTIQIPAGAIVLAVSVRVTVAIPTAATFTVIGNTSTTAFNAAAVAVAANSTDPGTAAGAFYNAAAQTIRITPNLTPGANTGRVRVTILYIASIVPTS